VTILRERYVWRAYRDPDSRRTSTDLTPNEQANVKRALRAMGRLFRSYARLALAMQAKHETVKDAAKDRGRVTAGLALRLARVARVSVETIIDGVFTPPDQCPYCGRTRSSTGRRSA
jgi:hypothetical protein